MDLVLTFEGDEVRLVIEMLTRVARGERVLSADAVALAQATLVEIKEEDGQWVN